MSAPHIVGFGGTTRQGSSGERLAAAVLARTADLGAKTRLFCGCELAALPHFAPENSARTPQQIDFIDAIRLSRRDRDRDAGIPWRGLRAGQECNRPARGFA